MFAEINGLQIAYDKTGQGYPLLLIHGYPETRREWRKVTPALRYRFGFGLLCQIGRSRFCFVLYRRRVQVDSGFLQKRAGIVVKTQQRLDLSPQFIVVT